MDRTRHGVPRAKPPHAWFLLLLLVVLPQVMARDLAESFRKGANDTRRAHHRCSWVDQVGPRAEEQDVAAGQPLYTEGTEDALLFTGVSRTSGAACPIPVRGGRTRS